MVSLQVVNLFGDSKHPGMAYHNRPEEDPYITVHEDSDSDKDDFVLKSADRLILAARNEDDVSHLEVGLEPRWFLASRQPDALTLFMVFSLPPRERSIPSQRLWKGHKTSKGYAQQWHYWIVLQAASMRFCHLVMSVRTPGAMCRRLLLRRVLALLYQLARMESDYL